MAVWAELVNVFWFEYPGCTKTGKCSSSRLMQSLWKDCILHPEPLVNLTGVAFAVSGWPHRLRSNVRFLIVELTICHEVLLDPERPTTFLGIPIIMTSLRQSLKR